MEADLELAEDGRAALEVEKKDLEAKSEESTRENQKLKREVEQLESK